jgi:hypothetical protein
LHPSSKPSIEKIKPIFMEDEEEEDDVSEKDHIQKKRVRKEKKKTKGAKKKIESKVANSKPDESSIIMTRSQKQKGTFASIGPNPTHK